MRCAVTVRSSPISLANSTAAFAISRCRMRTESTENEMAASSPKGAITLPVTSWDDTAKASAKIALLIDRSPTEWGSATMKKA